MLQLIDKALEGARESKTKNIICLYIYNTIWKLVHVKKGLTIKKIKITEFNKNTRHQKLT